eukprot:TRINITY_DN30649_c0_g1_i1.p1 TRINITY_DN30649_c0_g1~~TRINITY_DN30649_c0_g1_i1.p1  ORF type:complete len:284 (+),score=84.19 TRINITY_DN30649_c0_g1_i1:46-897(+)
MFPQTVPLVWDPTRQCMTVMPQMNIVPVVYQQELFTPMVAPQMVQAVQMPMFAPAQATVINTIVPAASMPVAASAPPPAAAAPEVAATASDTPHSEATTTPRGAETRVSQQGTSREGTPTRRDAQHGGESAAQSLKYVLVCDPKTKERMKVPMEALQDTRGLDMHVHNLTNALESRREGKWVRVKDVHVCMLHQKLKCRSGRRCNQIHIEKEFVDMKREEFVAKQVEDDMGMSSGCTTERSGVSGPKHRGSGDSQGTGMCSVRSEGTDPSETGAMPRSRNIAK